MKEIPQQEFLQIVSEMLKNHKEEVDSKLLRTNKKIRVINNVLRKISKAESREVFENITGGKVKTLNIETIIHTDSEKLNEIIPDLMKLCQKYKIKQITAFYE